MKTFKLIAFSLLTFSIAGNLLSQTADEIINKHLQVIGGRDRVSKISSIAVESTIIAMGAQGIVKSTTLNGKASRTTIEIAGLNITSCFNEKDGWSINTMMGETSAKPMSAVQYNLGKEQIVIESPFINYVEKGYKIELLGKDTVDNAETYKIRFTSPDSLSSVYYFDSKTFYLVQTESQSVAVGQIVESLTSYSDFRQTDGYTIPYRTILSLAGGQYINEMAVTKVEINVPVDEQIFKKPE